MQLYKENEAILRSDFKTQRVTNKAKNDVWRQITRAVNGISQADRSVTEVAKRWFTILSQSRSRISQHKAEMQRTGKYYS